MKLRKDGIEVDTRVPANHLKVKDLQPGDVFRFKRGHQDNVYIVGADKSHFLIPTSCEFFSDRYKDNSLVCLYPNAMLDLGEEVCTKEQKRKVMDVRVVTDPDKVGD